MSEPVIRILHTADWHLGRRLGRFDREDDFRAALDWLAAEIESREIDVVIMAGDIYDRALPPVDAVKMHNRQLPRLAGLADLILVTGNHDSVNRMGFGPMLREGLHLRSGIEGLGEPVLIERDFQLAIYPIPYLDPMTMANELDLDESTHTAVIEEAVRRCRDDLASRGGARSIAVGHAFITGSETSESERSIQVGGSESVSASVFDGFDYVALGHLHRPQAVGGHIRYAGSPIPLSYSEVGAGAPKSVTVLELSADGSIEQEQVEIPQMVGMARVSATLEELLNKAEFKDIEGDWLEVTLTDSARPDQPMDRLRSRFENVVSLRFDAPISSASEREARELAEIAEADPARLVSTFLEEVRGSKPTEAEAALVREALDWKSGEETVS
ncbi:MAG: exonuclease SbcCD subunit D C-terminal domain-containing protein [Solirubrobacterales bacterium]|nr:exonuclease SbcCD subunit D C-terminal domain-containing protein [Solirubrobacterales bacterium]